MNNEEKPMTSRRERRLAQAARADERLGLTPAQSRAEEEARASAEARGDGGPDVLEGSAAPSREAAALQGAPAVRSGKSAARDGGPAVSTETGRIRARRALDVPPDSVRAERTSQVRARDREAHRVLRELAEKEHAAQFPSRRSLRQQTQAPGGEWEVQEQELAPEAGVPPLPQRAPASGDIPAQALPVVPAAPPQEGPGPLPGEAPPSSAPGNGVQAPGRPAPVRRAPVRQAPDGSPVLGPETGSFSRLSHEQIAAAREALKGQAKNQAVPGAGPRGEGDAVDPEVLKQQVAVAEREAILSRRAQARQRLAEETKRDAEATRKAGPAPTSANNLAMVTPLEFMKVPGLPHPVMKPPTTTHVPVVTDRTPEQRGRGRTAASEAAPIAAASAHGLEPLRPQTSRVNRERLFFLSIGALGIVALVVAVLIVLLGR
ncbi:hypothetical protein [Sinomonas sp. ASV322]|uniref:hypothetical protein n=1 Tax=Sinomonas sp. ASV322 TaxID=3041920 RepID=UPI0027DBC819|nr:hypothetical protein [Sinomonas sp. ASV322]MDQ4502349.1 hypothetical protein [Sinomonas sp. ASV322]